MPHRKNAKADIGCAKVASDSLDIDNIYLTEEGWVYRHYKRADKSRWWDEVLVAGQVKTDISTPVDMVIHGVPNQPVHPTLNNIPTINPTFEDGGDDFTDEDYKPHEEGYTRALGKVDMHVGIPATGIPFDQIPWSALGVQAPVKDDLSTQIPDGWSDVSTPAMVEEYPNEPPYPGGAGDGKAGSGDGIYDITDPTDSSHLNDGGTSHGSNYLENHETEDAPLGGERMTA